MNERRDLVDILIERQRRLGLSDMEFAAILGVSRQAWGFFRSGERTPGRASLQRIAAAYPDLLPDVIALFLPQNATNVTETDTKRTGAEAKA